jgi:hypothetical protein
MIKSLIFYKNLEDPNDFREFYSTKILPKAKEISNIVGIKVTNVFQQVSKNVTIRIDGIQFIVELYFESEEKMTGLLKNSEGKELMKVIEESPGEIFYLLGNQQVYSSK